MVWYMFKFYLKHVLDEVSKCFMPDNKDGSQLLNYKASFSVVKSSKPEQILVISGKLAHRVKYTRVSPAYSVSY